MKRFLALLMLCLLLPCCAAAEDASYWYISDASTLFYYGPAEDGCSMFFTPLMHLSADSQQPLGTGTALVAAMKFSNLCDCLIVAMSGSFPSYEGLCTVFFYDMATSESARVVGFLEQNGTTNSNLYLYLDDTNPTLLPMLQSGSRYLVTLSAPNGDFAFPLDTAGFGAAYALWVAMQ